MHAQKHGCSILSHDRQQGSLRQKTPQSGIVRGGRGGDKCTETVSSLQTVRILPKSLPLQSPSTDAAGLGHLPLQHKLQVNVWADNSSRQVKTHRRVGGGGGGRRGREGGGDLPQERNPHELWESEFGRGREPCVLARGAVTALRLKVATLS